MVRSGPFSRVRNTQQECKRPGELVKLGVLTLQVNRENCTTKFRKPFQTRCLSQCIISMKPGYRCPPARSTPNIPGGDAARSSARICPDTMFTDLRFPGNTSGSSWLRRALARRLATIVSTFHRWELKESELFSHGSAGAEGPREVMVQPEQTERLINNPAFLPLTEQADDGGRVWMCRHGDQDGGDDLALVWTHVDPRDTKPT